MLSIFGHNWPARGLVVLILLWLVRPLPCW